jgi:hypothetical protein
MRSVVLFILLAASTVALCSNRSCTATVSAFRAPASARATSLFEFFRPSGSMRLGDATS